MVLFKLKPEVVGDNAGDEFRDISITEPGATEFRNSVVVIDDVEGVEGDREVGQTPPAPQDNSVNTTDEMNMKDDDNARNAGGGDVALRQYVNF